MATVLTTRETAGAGATVKNAPLTNEEVDNNFISITTNKLEASNNLSDLSDIEVARQNIGLEIGVDIQAFDENAATFDTVNPTFTDTGALGIPIGNNTERPSVSQAGQIRFNTDLDRFEGYNGGEWDTIGGSLEIQSDVNSSGEFYPTFTDSVSGDQEISYVSDGKLIYEPVTGTLGAVVFNSLSDATVKTNIHSVDNALDTVLNLTGVEFDWKDNGDHSAGLIAQDVEKILPHLVSTNSNGVKSINYAGLSAYLITAIKELQNLIHSK